MGEVMARGKLQEHEIYDSMWKGMILERGKKLDATRKIPGTVYFIRQEGGIQHSGGGVDLKYNKRYVHPLL